MVDTVLAIGVRLFGSCCDTGSCRAHNAGGGTTRVEFTGCVGFSRHLWMELRGSMECFAEQASKSPATSLLVSAGRDGDPSCVMDLTWRH